MRLFMSYLGGVSLSALLLLTNASAAGFFDDAKQTKPGATIYTAKRILACTLVKASYKGENEGLFSDAEKSLEGYCHARDGSPLAFSARMDLFPKLRDHAGRRVLIYLSDEKVANAKTDWSVIDIKPTDSQTYKIEKICGPEQGQQLFQDEKIWSRGFRVAETYEAKSADKSWAISAYVGMNGGEHWTDGEVLLSQYCAADTHKIIELHEPLIYTYVQPKETDEYFVESIYRLSLNSE